MTLYPCTARPRYLVLMACAICMASQAGATSEAFRIDHVSVTRLGDELRLHANIHYRLSEPVAEALKNGIPMPFELEVQVKSLRRWTWNRTVTSIRHSRVLKYHALSKQYLLEDLDHASVRAFPDLDSALMSQGRIHFLRIADTSSLSRGSKYVVQLRSRLLTYRLPLPLRLESYFSSEWRLESGWSEWPL